MHCVVSWDITEQGFPPRAMIEEQLKAALQPYPWVKPLTTFYIVQLTGQLQWNHMVSQLTQAGQRYPNRVHLVVSPLMSGGTYSGLLPPNLWPEINRRTT